MFGRKRKLDDFTSEIEAHLQLEIDRLREQGLGEEEARATARRSFGNLMQAEERFYESGRWLGWDHLWQDARYALRMLRKARGFTAVGVLTLALGVGANTAIFSIVNAVLLRSLPFREPDRLVKIFFNNPGTGLHGVRFSVPEMDDLRNRAGVFEHVSAAARGSIDLTGGPQPQRLETVVASPNYFFLLRATPRIGRLFDSQDFTPGYAPAVVINTDG
jgi:hypothetical protein